MNRAQIDLLLEKYWNAETSIAEEKQLRAYFSSEEIAEDLSVYQEFFTEISLPKTEQLSADFDEKILAQIEQADDKVYKLKSANKRNWLWQAAAIFLLVFSTTLFVISDKNNNNSSISQSEKIEAENAYKKTILALNIVSNKLKKGQKPLTQLGKIHKNIPLKFN